MHCTAEFAAQSLHVYFLEEVVDAFGTHLGHKVPAFFPLHAFIGLPALEVCDAVLGCEVLVLGDEVHLLETILLRNVLSCHETGVHHYVFLIVDDGFQLLGRHTQKGADLVGSTLEVPDMSYRNGEGDVTHALTADFLLSYFHAAAVAHDSAITDSLVLAAVALVIFGGAEDLLAEKTLTLRLVSPVVDRFRLQDFSAGTLGDVFRGSEADGNAGEIALYLVFLIVKSRHNLTLSFLVLEISPE